MKLKLAVQFHLEPVNKYTKQGLAYALYLAGDIEPWRNAVLLSADDPWETVAKLRQLALCLERKLKEVGPQP